MRLQAVVTFDLDEEIFKNRYEEADILLGDIQVDTDKSNISVEVEIIDDSEEVGVGASG